MSERRSSKAPLPRRRPCTLHSHRLRLWRKNLLTQIAAEC